ncbi:DUF550 domain-containing protein [Salmonella enterica subsp. arizonae serovar 62:z4,z23:-]|nr:DUF550 domain-containing protein [Salmonella enterica subsp. arizonae serovar 62:z4,z23:-]
MAELLNKAASAVAELQERRRTDNQEPAPERERIRREHAEWSDATFGDVGPIGPLKHLSKEALEAAAEPDDLSEWADMQFLLWDAQRRAGIRDEQINQAMIEKLAINKARQWPEPKDGEPRQHIKELPAPVKQPSNDDVIGWLRSDYNSDDKRDPDAPLFMLGSNNPSETWGVKYMPLTGNSPVTPDGYALVPVEPTDEMIAAAMNCEDVLFNSDESFCVQFGNIYEAMLLAAPQQGTTNL